MANRVSFSRSFDYNERDVLVAFRRVIARQFGDNPFRGVPKPKKLFRRLERAPVYYTPIKTGINQEVVVAQGHLEIVGIPGFFDVCSSEAVLYAEVEEPFRPIVEDIFTKVKTELTTASIFRGKAVSTAGGFLDLSTVDENQLVYNDKVRRDLEAHVWAAIEKPDLCRKMNARLPRKIVLEGPYGSGKTLAVMLTMQRAIEHGWTAFYLKPTSKDQIAQVENALKMARYYEPSILAIEDFDREQRGLDEFGLGALMMAIDGVVSKGSRVITIMTTNHLDRIVAGMQRPGRTDHIIHFGKFEHEDIVRLLKLSIPEEFLDKNVDWPEVTKFCDGYTPAFVGGVASNAKFMAIGMAKGEESPLVTQEILVEASRDLQLQHKACADGVAGFKPDK